MGINVSKLLVNVGGVQTSSLDANRYGTKFKNAGYATSVPVYNRPVCGNTIPNADKLVNYNVPGLVLDRIG